VKKKIFIVFIFKGIFHFYHLKQMNLLFYFLSIITI